MSNVHAINNIGIFDATMIKTLNEEEAKIIKSIDTMKKSGMPIGLIVSMLHAHATLATLNMINRE